MNLKTWLKGYVAAWLVLAALDALWLGWLARDFYRDEMADVIGPQVRVLPAALFYLLYPVMLTWLALWPRPDRWRTAALRSGGVGLTAYGTYDLVNWSTLAGWSGTLTLVDVAWGFFISAMAGTAAWRAQRP